MNISDIQVETRALVDADTTSYAAPLMLIRNNTAMEEINQWINECTGHWKFDDANNTDYPDDVALLVNLVNNTKSYALDVSIIKVLGAAVLLNTGIWRKLLPFDPDTDLGSTSTPLSFVPLVAFGPTFDRSEFLKTSGLPQYYDLHGSYMRLYPAPDNGVSVTLTNGLKIYAQRTANLFTTSDVTTGTKVPGFNSQFHSLVSYMSALPYAQAYKAGRVPFLMQEIARKKAALIEFYSRRDKDYRPIMAGRKIRYL
jgi:hypothetical protein